MFSRDQIATLVDTVANHPHTVRLLSPYSADIRPEGFRPGGGGYRVILERRAFTLHVSLMSDVLATGLRAAVVNGVSNNPQRLDLLTAELRAIGWKVSANFSPGHFSLDAVYVGDRVDLTDQLPSAVQAAVSLSQFILDQLVISRHVGEMRPSVLRMIADGTDDSDPWIYDPDARDKATARHRALENWLIEALREGGLEPLDAASEPWFDVAWRLGDGLVVCEVKTTGANPAMQFRLGIGQVLHYKAQLEAAGWHDVVPALLLEHWPTEPAWQRLVSSVGVVAFDPHRWILAQEHLGWQAT